MLTARLLGGATGAAAAALLVRLSGAMRPSGDMAVEGWGGFLVGLGVGWTLLRFGPEAPLSRWLAAACFLISFLFVAFSSPRLRWERDGAEQAILLIHALILGAPAAGLALGAWLGRGGAGGDSA